MMKFSRSTPRQLFAQVCVRLCEEVKITILSIAKYMDVTENLTDIFKILLYFSQHKNKEIFTGFL